MFVSSSDFLSFTFMNVIILVFNVKQITGTAFDTNNPAVWRIGDKSVENGIYMAVTDAPVPVQFNISDLSTIGRSCSSATL